MMSSLLKTTVISVGKVRGSSPSDSRFYVLILFDISESKKYRLLTRILKRYATRIQKSIYEASLKPRQIKEMTESIENIMSSERYFNSNDSVRIYRIAANCDVTIIGEYVETQVENDIFI